jgi:hypothetical protein
MFANPIFARGFYSEIISRAFYYRWGNYNPYRIVRISDNARYLSTFHRPSTLRHFFEDLPSNTKPNMIYTEEHIEIAKKRMEAIGRNPPAKFTRAKVLGFFTTWHVYLLTPRKWIPYF